ncbi:hypothetical protein EJB05_46903, partial [Eragrostis curvula]
MPAALTSSNTNTFVLSEIFPEPISEVFLQRHISPSEYSYLHDSKDDGCNSSSYLEDFPLLKLGVLFMPHDLVKDLKSDAPVKNCSVEAIDGEKQQTVHLNVHPHQLDKLLLPKAAAYLLHNAEAMTYQMSWKSAHGSAHLCVEKASIEEMTAHRAMRQGRRNKNKVLQMQDQMMKGKWKQVARDFMKLCAVGSPDELHASFTAWLNQLG